jgi:acetyl-CoA carboxylase biotin carboxylase subunit
MPVRRIQKLLIANRGEIAVRIARTCKDLGIRTVAVFSEVDRGAMHVELADEAYELGGKTPAESYLRQDLIIESARKSGADAIHPGYGFLSENPFFAHAVEESGLVFVGPSSESIRLLGDKLKARAIAHKFGVPTVSGTAEPVTDARKGLNAAREIGFPVLLKAAAGGGGKGMRVVAEEMDFNSSLQRAQSEALAAFGDERVYLERYIENPRHVEMQILGDKHGNVVWLGERECSIQRRHQKVIEESPSPAIGGELRQRLGDAAVQIAKAASYWNAGTVEFLVDHEGNFNFLEVNTRLQVEHPVTELVTGLDLVEEQIRIAEGEPLRFSQADVKSRGHAIECRIYAEDPWNEFFPSTGKLTRLTPPDGPRVRVDRGYREGDTVSVYYDPMLAKVITWGNTRPEALRSMSRALQEFSVVGVETTIPFCHFVMNDEEFTAGIFDTHFVSRRFSGRRDEDDLLTEIAALAAVIVKERKQKESQANGADDKPNRQWKNRRMEFLRE